MCKKFFILVLLIFAFFPVFSQINFGVGMGANFSYLIGKDRIEDSKRRIGMCPGVFVDFPLVYESFLEIGAMYSQQGVSIKTEENIRGVLVKYTENRNIDFLVIPITWKQRFGDFYTQAGPYVGLAMDASLTWKKDSIAKDTSIRTKGTKASFVNVLRQYDVGAMFGVGYQNAIARGLDLFIGVNYRMGFFSVEDRNKTQIRNKVLRNQVFSVTAGLFFVKNRSSKTYRGHRR